ncbi:MAG: monovalent cation/H+ antiporter complex subunit F [Bacteroidales bacterium]|nr:monovalent cation/H+ antiporter complex subunit F [Bacteroidales bacterium]MDD4217059.1 monovalent cation/H+ antiporter complex subunit F [Bacteroidales bacterium]MDY0142501.1 monovalent cation/H+ antiporter complex subunit F [Bacteroidales bacterium]
MVEQLLNISAIIILISVLLSLYRFIKGPTSFDRIAAFDTMTISTIGLIGIISYLSGRIIYIDIAIVYGLLSFLGVIIISKYLEKSL